MGVAGHPFGGWSGRSLHSFLKDLWEQHPRCLPILLDEDIRNLVAARKEVHMDHVLLYSRGSGRRDFGGEPMFCVDNWGEVHSVIRQFLCRQRRLNELFLASKREEAIIRCLYVEILGTLPPIRAVQMVDTWAEDLVTVYRQACTDSGTAVITPLLMNTTQRGEVICPVGLPEQTLVMAAPNTISAAPGGALVLLWALGWSKHQLWGASQSCDGPGSKCG